MDLRLYNSLTRQKDVFVPIDASDVRLYVCGPTVYDRAHIGNARPLLVFDVLFRLLRQRYGAGHVRYVRNITDVDDKIIERAAELGVGIDSLTKTTIQGFEEDWIGLGCLRPTVEPRATGHIGEMIAVIEKLVAAGHAYAAQGHVLFDSPSMPDYGALSRRPLDEMIAGARVEVAGYKKSDTDFVLWKPAAADEPGWDSPWGRGRPGWHIECSAMSWAHLGEVFDIHGGGIDLIFPHHENEIAQSRCAFGHAVMASVWMHNGFLQVEGEKMSKSTGNFVTIRQLLGTDAFGGRSWPGEVLRLAMLRKHYRSPIDWTVQALDEAERTLDRWSGLVDRDDLDPAAAPAPALVEALGDDLNTPQAVSELHTLFTSGDVAVARASARLLGLLDQTPAAWRAQRQARLKVDETAVQRLVEARLEARRARNWAESDRLRDDLVRLGIVLKDNKDGTTSWSLAAGGAPVSGLALRPMLPDEGPALAALFRASIEILAEDDYSEGQREAWMARAQDETAFAKRLSGALTLVATAAGEAAGFATLTGGAIDMLYVAPDHARRGVASLLVEALERLATARKVDKLTVDASDTARDFFAARGFVPQSRNTVPIGEEWLGNTTMTKALAAAGPLAWTRERLTLFDTTLRDGAQTTGVDFSLADKRHVAAMLDDLGLDYVEGGYPGANPQDTAFFDQKPVQRARFAAFGMTKRPGRSAHNDPGLAALLEADCDTVVFVAKAWDYHVRVALGITLEENLEGIAQSVRAVVERGREAMLDCEHFFDGFRANPDYALACVRTALEAGARWAVLCDTNGGTLPHEVEAIVARVVEHFPGERIGIHTHNDTENAVANALAAVRAGARQIQGTLNGIGERCGNANLVSLIPTLLLKPAYAERFTIGVGLDKLAALTKVSHAFDELLNRAPDRHAPYVGASAFATKAGIHASAVAKDPRTYEHVDPAQVGNSRKVLVSVQGGRSNVLAELERLGIAVDRDDPRVSRLLDEVKEKEAEGYAFEGADASFLLLARRVLGEVPHFFDVERFGVNVERRFNAAGQHVTVSEAVVKVRIDGESLISVAEGNGPVNALDLAFRKDLGKYQHLIADLELVDYRVRVFQGGSDAVTRVLIEFADGEGRRWTTVGVSANIIDASFQALVDAVTYRLLMAGAR